MQLKNVQQKKRARKRGEKSINGLKMRLEWRVAGWVPSEVHLSVSMAFFAIESKLIKLFLLLDRNNINLVHCSILLIIVVVENFVRRHF